jgi:hypothetical protein
MSNLGIEDEIRANFENAKKVIGILKKVGRVDKETINCRELNNRKFFKDKHGWNSSSLTPNGLLSINIEGYRPKFIAYYFNSIDICNKN